DGAGDQSLDHRGARRETLGDIERGQRRGVYIHAAHRSERGSMSVEPTIFVVDDDQAVCRALASAGALLDHPVREFGSAAEFLAAYDPDHPGCLVLDI